MKTYKTIKTFSIFILLVLIFFLILFYRRMYYLPYLQHYQVQLQWCLELWQYVQWNLFDPVIKGPQKIWPYQWGGCIDGLAELKWKGVQS